MKTSVIIETGHGGTLGTGHVQRMALLAHHLSAIGIDTAINLPLCPAFLSPGAEKYFGRPSPSLPSLIIRDKRDSGREEILGLREKPPVIALDDAGPGRYEADAAIDLLPGPLYENERHRYRPGSFIYGWNFYRALLGMEPGPRAKDIDFVFYTGQETDEELEKAVLSILPGASRAALCSQDPAGPAGLRIVERGITETASISWTELLVRSKFIISHFGISLFEAALAGCGLISLNPGPYHSGLAEKLKDRFSLLNLGVADDISSREAADKIARFCGNANSAPADPRLMLEEIKRGLTAFIITLKETPGLTDIFKNACL